MRTKRDNLDVLILFFIVSIGILLRLPLGQFMSIDYSTLMDPDSFLFARKAIEFYNEPFSEWELFSSRLEDSLMNVTNLDDNTRVTNMLPIIVALICKTFRFLSIDKVIYFFCAILCPLASIPVYLFVKKRTDRVGAIVSSFIASITPSYFVHSIAGYFDTDAINMVLTLAMMLCFVEVFFCTNNVKKFFLVLFSVIFATLFAFTWEGFYFYILVCACILIITIVTSKILGMLVDYIYPSVAVTLMAIVGLLIDNSALTRMFGGLFEKSDWPDPGKYISELADLTFCEGDINTVFNVNGIGLVNLLGGLPMFFAIVLSIAFVICICVDARKREEKLVDDEKLLSLIVITSWIIVVIPFLTMGIRFVQLVALPTAILLGLSVSLFFELLGDKSLMALKKSVAVLFVSIMIFGSLMKIGVAIALIIAVLFLVFGLQVESLKAKKVVAVFLSIMIVCPFLGDFKRNKLEEFANSNLKEAIDYINNETSPNSTLVSWWEYGYYYQYATKRQTVADGGTYSGEYYYWLANIFTTDDIDLSVGICKMLQSGSIEAGKIALEYTNSNESATELLKKVLRLDRESAKQLLISEYGYSDEQTNNLLLYTHPLIDKPIYLIVTRDIYPIFSGIAYYGNWNFKDDKEYSVVYNADTEKYYFDKEIDDSILANLCRDTDYYSSYKCVYENDDVWIYEIV